ncbi:tubulin-specific chaperone E [Cynoglossus semilaevis]|uniref:Tubulin-specific chaperone E n=1 Tax=Cynoglossus semilaevis TaxID=244447 RepID=A0A3P8UGB0_CYNSE|nr:tubulin-specific chaperone E [Cynoglossus semilaevis]
MGVGHPDPEVPTDAVGRRVLCGADRATVRYVGPVPPTTGLWLGVEWDEPDRGKHDGSHDGVQYFSCRHPKGGSFVRPAKANFGVDYVTAVRQVYDSEVEAVLSEDAAIPVTWTPVKNRSLQSLTSVLLNNAGVSGVGSDGEVRKMTPNVEWLDLSRSLMSSWKNVAEICEQLEKLERLVLSFNRLSLTSGPLVHCQAFCRLKVLSLISCDLTWPQILECAPMWPQLEELYVEENNITELQRPEGVLQNIRCLNLSSNPLQQETLLCLSTLNRLEQLNLSNTGLSIICFDDVAPGCQTAMFPALTELNLHNNNISEWSVVDELSKLSSLVKLSIHHNLLATKDRNRKTADQVLIAKMGRLETLNNSQIPPQERRGAELDYIKMFGEEWLKAGGQSQINDHFACQHPHYQSLILKYGAPEEGELKKPLPFALKNQLLKIKFVFPDDAEKMPIEKKLPASMIVQKVKGVLHRLVKIPVSNLKLSYTSPKKAGTEFEIDSDMKTLHFYSIEDGDQILVRWS